MDRKVKVVQFGTGKMAVYTMRYVLEKGGEIVGAIDVNPAVIGKDVSEVIGTWDKLDVKVTSLENAEEMMREVKPDIAIVTTMSLIEDVKEALMLCAKLGVNAITTCEEAFYPQNSNPVVTRDIDELAKKNNCTITGSGYQDIYWGQLISSIAGDNISEEERIELINNGKFLPSYMWNVNGWLCSKLGLTVLEQTQKCVPQVYKEDIESSTLGMTVKAGQATGMSAVVTTKTKEGITLETECIGKVYSKEDFDKNEWSIYGEPDTTIVVARPSTVELTCASVVNRIPDVLNAEPGYVTTEKMGELQYRVKPLNEYVNHN